MTQPKTRSRPRSNPLLSLLALNLAGGAAVAALAVAGLYSFDLFGLRELTLLDQSPVLAIAILAFGFLVTFGSVAMGAAVMMLGEDGEDDPEPRESGRTPAERTRSSPAAPLRSW